jgi:hypothetical protein
MILTTNSFFGEIATNGVSQWYAAENGAVETEQNCIPIFYVLDDVQIHCDSDGLILGSSSSNVISNILNQNPGQINFFLSEIFVPSNPSATGFASNFGNYLAIERIDGGLIGHELGHVLGLNHTYMSTGGPFEFGCNDIWDTAWEWDMDGDGIVDLTGDRCWINSASHNGLDACDETNFAIPHPCCSWQAQNNNLMGGTAFSGNPTVAALTPCQIDKMLTNITCDLVSDVGCS